LEEDFQKAVNFKLSWRTTGAWNCKSGKSEDEDESHNEHIHTKKKKIPKGNRVVITSEKQMLLLE
jgi:hypothetical protein